MNDRLIFTRRQQDARRLLAVVVSGFVISVCVVGAVAAGIFAAL